MKLKIIHTNDIHSCFDKYLKASSIIKKYYDDNTILLDAGDFNDYSNPYVKISDGLFGLNLLSQLKYDGLAIGNNEGFQKENNIRYNATSKLVDIFSINIETLDGEKIDGVIESKIIEKNGIRILLFGISPYLPSYNGYYSLYGIKAFDPYDNIKKILDKNNYDISIAISHIGLKQDILLSQCFSKLDLIISGHSHHLLDLAKVNNTYISQSNVRSSHVGIIEIDYSNSIDSITSKNIDVSLYDNDIDIEKFYIENQSKYFDKLNEKISHTDFDFDIAISDECNQTNLLADHIYEKYKPDFAILFTGLTGKKINKGDISFIDVFESCNSLLNIVTYDIKGNKVIEAITESLKKEKCNDTRRRPGFRGKYLGKLAFSYNCEIRNNTLYINGIEIDSKKVYKIASTDYFSRGMGYGSLKSSGEVKMYPSRVFDELLEAIINVYRYKHINERRWKND